MMPSYIAKTHTDWYLFLKSRRITDGVNFWSPSPRPLLNDLQGNRLFMYARIFPRGKRKLVGWGTVRKYTEETVQEAWVLFDIGNGADTVFGMLDRMGSIASHRHPVSRDSVIGNNILDDVVWLDDPVDIEALGIHVAPQAVRGRTLEPYEEQELMDCGG